MLLAVILHNGVFLILHTSSETHEFQEYYMQNVSESSLHF